MNLTPNLLPCVFLKSWKVDLFNYYILYARLMYQSFEQFYCVLAFLTEAFVFETNITALVLYTKFIWNSLQNAIVHHFLSSFENSQVKHRCSITVDIIWWLAPDGSKWAEVIEGRH